MPDYFIRDKAQPEGPYDMMSIIRKIRNGSVKESTPLSSKADGALQPAGQYTELQSFFKESDPDDVVLSRAPVYRKPPPNFTLLIKRQFDFLMQNLFIAIYSGVFMLIWLALGYLLFSGSLIGEFIGAVFSYFILGAYFFGVHKYVRGNPLEMRDMLDAVKNNAVQMLIASVIFASLLLPGLAAVVLTEEEQMPITLPILCGLLFLVMALFAFVPLLIVHKQCKALPAIRESLRCVLANRAELLGVVFALTTLNFLFLPFLMLVLPVTSCALADLYDEYIG